MRNALCRLTSTQAPLRCFVLAYTKVCANTPNNRQQALSLSGAEPTYVSFELTYTPILEPLFGAFHNLLEVIPHEKCA